MEERNASVFGKCNNPHGHGHNYEIEVTVGGSPPAETGMVMDLKKLADLIQEEIIEKVDHVSDYYGMVVSHRVVAENAGIGWRGKNQLIVNERYSCAIRLASVILSLPLVHDARIHQILRPVKTEVTVTCPTLTNAPNLC